jgi:hypothetical protein
VQNGYSLKMASHCALRFMNQVNQRSVGTLQMTTVVRLRGTSVQPKKIALQPHYIATTAAESCVFVYIVTGACGSVRQLA